MAERDESAGRPLCVDLDGSLIAADSLWESLLGIGRRPVALARVAWGLRGGRAAFKAAVCDAVALEAETLPYRAPLLDFLKEQKAAGRRLILATAADRRIAEAVAAHLGLFDHVLATDGGRNVKGDAKLAAIRELLGDQPFDYVGDADCDLPICEAAERVYLVEPSRRLERAVMESGRLERVFQSDGPRWRAVLAALRPHQWAKNLLVAVPLITSQRYDELGLWLLLALAFVALSLSASAGYVLNDLFDLSADRRHATKRLRPFASGALSIPTGLVMAAAMLLASVAIAAAALPAAFLGALLVYLAVSFAYSMHLKRVPVVDVLVLAGLYTLRIIAGGEAIGIPPSFWLLAFSVFLFLSLAFAKRSAELHAMPTLGDDAVAGRGYRRGDLQLVDTLGPVAGYLAVLVFCFYINSEMVVLLYEKPRVLWLMCPLILYWVTRLWFKAHRGELHEDPVVFALRDRTTWATAVLAMLVLLLAG